MRRGLRDRILLVIMVAILLLVSAGGVGADGPVVRAVLFYSPSCGHCHKVITEDFPPLFQKYGDQLQVIGVNVADEGGSVLFDAAGDKCKFPPENRGVPLLVVGAECLSGSVDIPTKFPALIEQYLAAGGVDWPDVPGLVEAIAAAKAPQPPAAPSPAGTALSTSPTVVPDAPTASVPPAPTPAPAIVLVGDDAGGGVGARFSRDPIGNGLSVIVLAGMVAALAWAIAKRPWRAWAEQAAASRTIGSRVGPPAGSAADWAVPLLCLIGLGVAGYLAYVETQQVQAICGPVGDCNSVQQSEYARLFGLIPIGMVGVLGYLAILAAWAVGRVNSGWIGQWARLAMWAMIVIGVLFSIYLTFLEPFIIGATCAWCLSSAAIMTLLLLLTSVQMMRSATRIRPDEAEVERQPA